MAVRVQLRNGSQGSDVKYLQETLKGLGYAIGVDGIFGSETEKAVRDYQQKNGLSVDGIVGTQTWGKLSEFTGGPVKATNNNFKYDPFTYDAYKESDSVTNAKTALDTQLAQKPGEYNSQWQAQLDDTINKILNREKFSYDLNGDALYQQYKDKYIKQGKMAMGDAIGQASAMTGGYGNSYAQSVGQQAYQAQLENLNDIVPELYQMAYDKYKQEGQDLNNQYAILGDLENQDYGRYRDSVGDWMTERDYLANRYDAERDYDYGKYADDRNFSYGQYSDDRNLAYSEYRNKIADDQWRKEFEEAQRQFNEGLALDKASSASSTTKKNSTPIVKNSVYDEPFADDPFADKQSKDPTYTYEETDAVTSFVARIRTRTEFGRGNNPDKEKYKTYTEYVKAMLEKYEDELTDNDIATISQKYGL